MKSLCYYFFIITIIFSSLFTEANELKVAVYLEPPYVDLVNDKLVGENIEIINLLAQSIKLTPIFIRCPPVRCLAMVKQGQADMILGLSKSSAREKDYIFLTPPYLLQHQPLRFFTLKEKQLTIKHFSDLDSLLIGTLRGAAYFPLFDNNQNLNKVELTSRKQLVNMLLKGRIDTFLEREETVLPLLSTAEYRNKFTMTEYQYNQPINSYIALSQRSKTKVYANKLSQVLAQAIADGTIEKIRRMSHDKEKKRINLR